MKLLKTLTIGEMHLMKKIKIRPNLEFKQKKNIKFFFLKKLGDTEKCTHFVKSH